MQLLAPTPLLHVAGECATGVYIFEEKNCIYCPHPLSCAWSADVELGAIFLKEKNATIAPHPLVARGRRMCNWG